MKKTVGDVIANGVMIFMAIFVLFCLYCYCTQQDKLATIIANARIEKQVNP